MFQKKRLLLGAGAAKAGTSWFYEYLKAHPEVCVSPIKELHFFDCVFGKKAEFAERWPNRLKDIESRIARYRAMPNLETSAERQEGLKNLEIKADAMRFRLKFLDASPNNHTIYKEYFSRYLQGENIYADITPAYGILSADAYRTIRKLHKNIQVVYIIRDPIERFYSQLRMSERIAQNRPDRSSRPAIDRFMSVLARENRQARGDYHCTIETLDAAFRPDQIRYFYYEEFFNDNSMRSLCDFIGIKFRSGNYEDRVNASPLTDTIPEDLLHAAKLEFAHIYKYCKDRFGRVPASWYLQ